MKLTQIISPLLLAATATADQAATLDQASLNEVYDKSLELMNKEIEQNPSARKNVVLTPMGKLQDYGCWCLFNAKHGKGKGTPVDAVDAVCKNLHHMHECILLDFDGTCDPYNTKFQVDVRISSNFDLEYDCEKLNGNDCQVATCYSMTHFTSGLIVDAFLEGVAPDYNNYGSGKAVTNGECDVEPFPGDREKICCGSYVYNSRRPVRYTIDNERACCPGEEGKFKTFLPEFNQCCEGQVLALGSCD